jgi:hypothetical protein
MAHLGVAPRCHIGLNATGVSKVRPSGESLQRPSFNGSQTELEVFRSWHPCSIFQEGDAEHHSAVQRTPDRIRLRA